MSKVARPNCALGRMLRRPAGDIMILTLRPKVLADVCQGALGTVAGGDVQNRLNDYRLKPVGSGNEPLKVAVQAKAC
jgi:hypothetical protein